MNIIRMTEENLEQEHICCSLSDKKGERGVADKKAWLKSRLADGLVFEKLDVRGKAFIEYIPAEKAWCPIEAPGYLYIDCFWVSGQWKGQGFGKLLLEGCIQEAKAQGKAGLVVLSSDKKRPYLSDGKYLRRQGFQLADTALPYYELLYLPFIENSAVPQFKQQAKEGRIDQQGMVLYYSHQCPHAAKYATVLEQTVQAQGETIQIIHLQSAAEAQNAPAPFTTYTFFDKGRLVTNEILSEKKILQYLSER